ncbi:hypothetical protein EVAR_56112_1 [Eumeta japonica]|uniref:Uncharacterized protein n=1 Tax=Eumeta variegata TaxID=151549 RepID=A0A4C1YG38_EUMVA|nr:hypothetical protein EVAR_56112_1 [Eumeta japonica]
MAEANSPDHIGLLPTSITACLSCRQRAAVVDTLSQPSTVSSSKSLRGSRISATPNDEQPGIYDLFKQRQKLDSGAPLSSV